MNGVWQFRFEDLMESVLYSADCADGSMMIAGIMRGKRGILIHACIHVGV